MSFEPVPPVPHLEEVRSLYARRDWPAIVRRLSSVPEAELSPEETVFHYADALRRVGAGEQALRLAQQAETGSRKRGERRLLLDVVNLIGMSLFETGRTAEAEDRFRELLEMAAAWGDEEFAARASNNLGVLANVRGRRDQALTYYQRALASYYRLGYLRGLAQTHHNLGISYRDLGFDREADRHFQRAIEFARAADTEDVVALAEAERALLRTRSGQGRMAEALAERARERFERMGDELGRAEALRVLAAAARVQNQEALAVTRLEEALSIARGHSDPLLHAEVQRDRGLLLRELGRPAEAAAALQEAAAHFTTLGATAEAEAVRAIALEL